MEPDFGIHLWHCLPTVSERPTRIGAQGCESRCQARLLHEQLPVRRDTGAKMCVSSGSAANAQSVTLRTACRTL